MQKERRKRRKRKKNLCRNIIKFLQQYIMHSCGTVARKLGFILLLFSSQRILQSEILLDVSRSWFYLEIQRTESRPFETTPNTEYIFVLSNILFVVNHDHWCALHNRKMYKYLLHTIPTMKRRSFPWRFI